MESNSFQNSHDITEKCITFDIPGWGHTQISVSEKMNAQDLYFFVGLDNVDIHQVIYRVDNLVIEAFKDESVKFIYEKCDNKVVQVIHILESIMESDDRRSMQLTKFIKD